ncbi:hypothetical protein MT340_000280 [Staphylococcus sp. NRL 16/872]|uniref:DUF2231 domain-containing protein n=1 Tax=Staphylococcus sp. NRL 16/872 TaxID=2930131 RepID=UPI001FB1A30C|nr:MULTISPECIES: DUF2231 domain-containing protein [unclassified Staphylococcus]MCJ1655220.1 hypothetical protein [Staphylococcus sp. NRL 21/187]MCJ1661053.1 hypothetical protein [Staphylococcus sp. NRL 18/288]MCJ1666952.1 hypothetical protein [Staphylococcus sp. NRL 19/737]WEN69424.1 hypothetical protein MT340_000280 [Staphylococcus sp. NRL 16/872]
MPLHPLFVHFPIALLSLATIIAIVNLFFKKFQLARTLTVLLITGMIFGVVSYMLGDSGEFYAMQHYGVDHVRKLVHLHEKFALFALMSYGLATITQLIETWFTKYRKASSIATVILTIIGFILLIIAGHLGASITYAQ